MECERGKAEQEIEIREKTCQLVRSFPAESECRQLRPSIGHGRRFLLRYEGMLGNAVGSRVTGTPARKTGGRM